MNRIFAAVALCLVSCASEAPPPAAAPCPTCPTCPTAAKVVTVDDLAKEMVAKMNAGDAKGVYDMFGPAMRRAVAQSDIETIVTGVQRDAGKLGAPEKTGQSGEGTSYLIVGERGNEELILAADDGKIAGALIRPAKKTPPVERTTLAMNPPFKGEWSVVWGGDTREKNHHIDVPSQRRAIDVLKKAGGRTFKTDGKTNPDYLAYGQDILAVADGTVVEVIDGIPDNVPGEMNPFMAFGNTVVVQHDTRLYSVYAHLVPNKIKTKVGAKVKRGEAIGLCGNSGNSSEAHLHFQLQDGPKLEQSWGIELVFANHVPVKGDVLVP